MIAETIPAIAELSREDQLRLSCELWQRNISDDLDAGTTTEILDFLKESRERYLADPDSAISHEELKSKYGRGSD